VSFKGGIRDLLRNTEATNDSSYSINQRLEATILINDIRTRSNSRDRVLYCLNLSRSHSLSIGELRMQRNHNRRPRRNIIQNAEVGNESKKALEASKSSILCQISVLSSPPAWHVDGGSREKSV